VGGLGLKTTTTAHYKARPAWKLRPSFLVFLNVAAASLFFLFEVLLRRNHMDVAQQKKKGASNQLQKHGKAKKKHFE
jgi:hypothetical protein